MDTQLSQSGSAQAVGERASDGLRADLAWVRRFRGLIAREIGALSEVIGDELGKPAFETLTSEIVPLLQACRWTERRGRRVLGARRLGGGGLFQIGQRHRVVRAPLGDVAIIATWNYPIQLLGIQLVHAIVGGNRVWVKPSERSPRTQGLLLDLAAQAGLSEHTGSRLSRVGSDRQAGERLLNEHTFDHVVFTGSTAVGRSIATRLAARLTPSTLELSGSDSAIVLADADIGLAARSIAFGLMVNAGQTCMAPRRVLIEAPVYDAFVVALRHEIGAFGERTTPRPDELERSKGAAASAVGGGGTWIAGGPNESRGIDEAGASPFVVGDCPVDSALFRGEHFGSAMGLVRVDSAEGAFAMHALVPKRLATVVFSRDAGRARRTAVRLGSTIVTINDCLMPTCHPGVGLGGLGESGWGLSRGAEGLLAMTRPVFVASTHPRVRVPTAEPSERIKQKMAGFVRWFYG